MKVTNKTIAVVNYNGRAYGPNASFDLADGDEEIQDIARMLGDGRLGVADVTKPASKPSDGLKVDELKKALADKGVAFDTSLKRDALAEMLDAS